MRSGNVSCCGCDTLPPAPFQEQSLPGRILMALRSTSPGVALALACWAGMTARTATAQQVGAGERFASDDSGAVSAPATETLDEIELTRSGTTASVGAVAGGVAAPGPRAEPATGAEVTLIDEAGRLHRVQTDFEGRFRFDALPPGRYRLVAQADAGQAESSVVVRGGEVSTRNVRLKPTRDMENIVVTGRRVSAAEWVEKSGFAVESVEIEQLRIQTLTLNDILDTVPGVRVRRNGGAGSDFLYSMHGLSGRSIRFFLDGVPMEFFGNAFSVNTIPTSLVERVDVYKGVVPAELGSDALGGAVNLVTRKSLETVVEASYSFGSFNTHEWATHGHYRERGSGLTTRASVLGTVSDNDYEVWGDRVVIADENARPVRIRAKRFNDQFQSLIVKGEVGFTNVSWADQALLGVVYSTLDRGIQTGQTMRFVYGDLSNEERLIMPNLTYQNYDLGVDGLSLNAFAMVVFKEATTDDTTVNVYDWSGAVIGNRPEGGEFLGGRGRSLYILDETSLLGRVGLSYRASEHHAFNLNFLASSVTREGEDEFRADYTVPLRDPQSLTKAISAVSYQLTVDEERFVGTAFFKMFVYSAAVNDGVLTTTGDGTQVLVSKPIDRTLASPGGGFTARYALLPTLLLKTSAEFTYRLPDTDEALGNGQVITNSPELEPERSANFNIGARLGRLALGKSGLTVSLAGFLRWTDNLILLRSIDGNGTGQYQNVAETRGTGVEGEVVYDYDQIIEFVANGTYLDIRNDQEFTPEGIANVVFGDRLRNTPYFMANAGLRGRFADIFMTDSQFFVYWTMRYVHEFFREWPSLGDPDTKDVIPTQFINDAGISYRFPDGAAGSLSLALDVSNMFNVQAFDNFALQKPGRAFFLKCTWQLEP